MKKRLRNQPKIKGVKRTARYAALIPGLDRKVLKDAREEDVSCSWVVAVILADHYHMQTPDYRATVRRRLKILKETNK